MSSKIGDIRTPSSSINQLQRKLYLPRRPRSLADNPEPTPAQNIGRQPEIHQVKNIEELRTKFQCSQLRISPTAERRVLDQRNVVLLKTGPADSVASQCAEAA